MTDNNIPGVNDVTGKAEIASRDILPESKWRVPESEFIPPAERGIGLYQGNGKGTSRKAEAAPEPEPAEKRTDYDNFEWEDFVREGREELASTSKSKWRLGDMALTFTRKAGRPEATDTDPRLSDLADAWDCSIQRASQWVNCAQFWPTNVRGRKDLEGFFWDSFSQARCRAEAMLPNEPHHKQLGCALGLLKEAAAIHLYKTDAFEAYAKAREFYPGDVWDKYIRLGWEFLDIARRASGGKLENAVELLEDAISKGITDVAKFREYCRPDPEDKPVPVVPVGGTRFVVPDSLTWSDPYYDALRELLPDNVRVGDTFYITVTKA